MIPNEPRTFEESFILTMFTPRLDILKGIARPWDMCYRNIPAENANTKEGHEPENNAETDK